MKKWLYISFIWYLCMWPFLQAVALENEATTTSEESIGEGMYSMDSYEETYDSLCAKDWGSSSDNGEWTFVGLNSISAPYWTRDGRYISIVGGGAPRWYMSANCYENSGCSTRYYEEPIYVGTNGTPDEVATENWVDNGGGTPIGTLEWGNCSATVSIPATSTTTAYDFYAGTLVFYLWLIYFSCFIFIIWFFRKNRS